MKYFIVDVFAQKKYSGNQLGVFILDKPISKSKMQKIALELNFAETTFIEPIKRDGAYKVYIFTPDVEVPFAGHPTLGTAFIINEILEGKKHKQIILDELVGRIPVIVKDKFYEMIQNQPLFGKEYKIKELSKIISLPEDKFSTNLPIQYVSTGLGSVIIPIKSKKDLKDIQINHKEYRKFLDKYGPGNLLIFAKDRNNIECRVFVDDTGFGEDPATGSANGNLAAYLLKYNYFGSHNISYKVSQGRYANRLSEIYVNASLRDGYYTIKVGGKVYLISEGIWL